MASKYCLLHLLPILISLISASPNLPPITYTTTRRGGSFPAPEVANLSSLLAHLRTATTRLTATTLVFRDDDQDQKELIRVPKRLHGTQSETILLGDVGREGNWFATLRIGEPVQTVDMDLDMLTADWWVFSTSSGTGSFFLDFNSRTYSMFSTSPSRVFNLSLRFEV